MSKASSAQFSTIARRNCLCASASDSMASLRRARCIQYGVGLRRLCQDSYERREVIVPFDHCRRETKAPHRMRIEVPYRFGDPCSMRIDQNGAGGIRLIRLGSEASE